MSRHPMQAAWAALLLLAAAPCARADSEPDASLDEGLYELLDRLDALGLVDSWTAALRPVSRDEAARLLVEASDRVERRSGLAPPDLVEELRRALFRFRWTVAGHGGFGPSERFRAGLHDPAGDGVVYRKPEIYLFPAARLTLATAYLDGLHPASRSLGLPIERGASAFASLSVHGRLASVLSFHARPELVLVPGEDATGRFAFRARETYAKLTALGLDVQAGFGSLAWGPGRHGNLLLARNPEPMPLLRLSPVSPFRLPWILEHLGLFRFDLFLARLERARAVPRALFAGLHVTWKPFPWVELGAMRTAMFGGEGRPAVDAEHLWKIWWGRYDNPHAGEEDLSNQMAGFHGKIRAVLGGVGVVLYGEAVGEDETNMFPYKWSTIAGLRVAGLPPHRSLDLCLEWAHTHRTAYVHGTYATGYRYRGHLLGHHVGRDGRDVFLSLSAAPEPGLRFTLWADWEARREAGPFQPEEEHVQVGLEGAWQVRAVEGARLTVGYQYRRVRNPGYRAGAVRDEHQVLASFSWSP